MSYNFFYRDCYTRTRTVFDTRIDVCRLSLGEQALQNPTNVDIGTFFKCMELFNSQRYRNLDGTDRPELENFSYAKDFLQMTTEICLLGKKTNHKMLPEIYKCIIVYK